MNGGAKGVTSILCRRQRLLARLDRAEVVTPPRAVVNEIALPERLLEVLASFGLETGLDLLLLHLLRLNELLLVRLLWSGACARIQILLVVIMAAHHEVMGIDLASLR